jgi:preprotein translocase subunit YajC
MDLLMPQNLLSLALLLQEGAPGDAAPTAGASNMLTPLLIVGGLFFFLLILPERKKQKKRTAMLSALKKGDRVMTTSGMYGTVVSTTDDMVVLQVADSVRLRFSRAAVQSVVEEKEEKEKEQDGKLEAEPSKS